MAWRYELFTKTLDLDLGKAGTRFRRILKFHLNSLPSQPIRHQRVATVETTAKIVEALLSMLGNLWQQPHHIRKCHEIFFGACWLSDRHTLCGLYFSEQCANKRAAELPRSNHIPKIDYSHLRFGILQNK